jgi:hypothetical protein
MKFVLAVVILVLAIFGAVVIALSIFHSADTIQVLLVAGAAASIICALMLVR